MFLKFEGGKQKNTHLSSPLDVYALKMKIFLKLASIMLYIKFRRQGYDINLLYL